MADVLIDVVGQPAPQGSKRAVRNQHTDRLHQVESSKKVDPWRQDVRSAALEQAPGVHIAEPTAVAVVFRFARPKSHYRTGRNAHLLRDNAPLVPAGSSNDVDKLARAVLDALVSAGVLADDGLVVDLWTSKQYAVGSQRAGATIELRPYLCNDVPQPASGEGGAA